MIRLSAYQRNGKILDRKPNINLLKAEQKASSNAGGLVGMFVNI